MTAEASCSPASCTMYCYIRMVYLTMQQHNTGNCDDAVHHGIFTRHNRHMMQVAAAHPGRYAALALQQPKVRPGVTTSNSCRSSAAAKRNCWCSTSCCAAHALKHMATYCAPSSKHPTVSRAGSQHANCGAQAGQTATVAVRRSAPTDALLLRPWRTWRTCTCHRSRSCPWSTCRSWCCTRTSNAGKAAADS
jgi:hypothetical protein